MATRPPIYTTGEDGRQVRADGRHKTIGYHRSQDGLGAGGLDEFYAKQNRALPAFYDPRNEMPSAGQVAGYLEETGRSLNSSGQTTPAGVNGPNPPASWGGFQMPEQYQMPPPAVEDDMLSMGRSIGAMAGSMMGGIPGQPTLPAAYSTSGTSSAGIAGQPKSISAFRDTLQQRAMEPPAWAPYNSREPFAATKERNRLVQSGALAPRRPTDSTKMLPGGAMVQTSQGEFGPQRSLTSKYGTGSSGTKEFALPRKSDGTRVSGSPTFRKAMEDADTERALKKWQDNPSAEDIKRMSQAFKKMGAARA